jgi:hypothetical protein
VYTIMKILTLLKHRIFLTIRTFKRYVSHVHPVNFIKEMNGKILNSKAGDHQKLIVC